MNAGKAVYGILSANSGVTDIVGTRIFPEIAEQEAATPFIVYQLLSVDPEDTHDGPSKLDEVRFEFLCYADSYNAAADLGVAVRAALDRVSGTYNGVNVESVQFNDVDVEIEYDPRRYSQVLKFTFRIKRDDVTIALGTPVTGAVLGDLSDVDVTGVTNGQLIAYNSTSGNWEAANDAGGANELSDLSDANVSLPSDGEVLIYSGGEFVNDNIAISNVTGLQAALDAAPDNLRELTDVTISGLADNDYLQYDSASGTWQNSPLILGRNGEQYTGNYDSEAETLLDGATETVELYYTAQADGDGLHEDAQTDTATTGFDIRRKLYYAEKAQADPNTSGDWTQFADIADDTTYASAKATLLAYLKARTGGTVPISLKMTWEEVAEAPTFTGLLNESYGSGAAAAYSVRRLNGLYTGSAIQVERSSDNTTQDIGFDSNGDLDESALSTFCSGTVCKVRTWYGQEASGGTGSGNDAVQTDHTKQPTIYTGGAIVKQDGRVGVDFDGSTNVLVNTTVSITDYDFSIVNVNVHPATNGIPSGLYLSTSSNTYYHHLAVGGSGTLNNRIQARVGATTGQGFTDAIEGERNLNYLNFTSATSRDITVNGVESGSNNTNVTFTAPNSFSIGAMNDSSPANYLDAIVQEVILYGATKSSADQISVEENIGGYFTQNTPLLDTYTGAAAAYSLRKLRSAYSGSAIRVRRASDNTESDIGFNVFGELSTVELAAFCGSSDGFVKTWYSQVGTGVDATQTTAANQPKIYDGTTGVVTENGKPTVRFTNQYLSSSASFTFSGANVIVGSNQSGSFEFATSLEEDADNQISLFLDSRATPKRLVRYEQSATTSFIDLDSQIPQGTQSLLMYNNDSGTLRAYVDSTAVSNTISFSSLSVTQLHLARLDSTTSGQVVNLQECIWWSSDQSTNRTGIEDNINTFYSIY